jgi:alcohol dehydrogenase, propanol-preferring
MKALLMEQAKKELVLGELPEPEPKQGEVLVELKACGICGTDVHIAREGTIPTAFTPIALGHEPAGIICELGSGVSGWKPGDRVAIYPHVYCGTCPACQSGREGLCSKSRIFGLHRHGAMAEKMVLPDRCLIALPDSISFEIGAIMTDAVSTPYHAVVRRAKLKKGESVAIFGCGGLGSQAIKFCKLFEAGDIIAVDTNDAALERAKTLGASHTIKVSDTPANKEIRSLTKGAGVDVAFEFVGIPQTINTAVRSLRRGGRAVVVGIGLEKIQLPAIRTFVGNEYELIGSMGLDVSDLKEVVSLVEQGKLNLDGTTMPIPYEGVNEALRKLEQGEANEGRYVLTHT